eukprot:927715_1
MIVKMGTITYQYIFLVVWIISKAHFEEPSYSTMGSDQQPTQTKSQLTQKRGGLMNDVVMIKQISTNIDINQDSRRNAITAGMCAKRESVTIPNINYPAGFMKVFIIPNTIEHLRLVYDTKGRFVLQSITAAEAKTKSQLTNQKRGALMNDVVMIKQISTNIDINHVTAGMCAKRESVTIPNFNYPTGFMNVFSIPNTLEHLRLLYDTKGRFVLHNITAVEAKVTIPNFNYPTGFMNVFSIPNTIEHLRLLYDTKGRFVLHSITAEEAKVTIPNFNYPTGFMNVFSIPNTIEHLRLLYDTKGRSVLHSITAAKAKTKNLSNQKRVRAIMNNMVKQILTRIDNMPWYIQLTLPVGNMDIKNRSRSTMLCGVHANYDIRRNVSRMRMCASYTKHQTAKRTALNVGGGMTNGASLKFRTLYGGFLPQHTTMFPDGVANSGIQTAVVGPKDAVSNSQAPTACQVRRFRRRVMQRSFGNTGVIGPGRLFFPRISSIFRIRNR